MQNENIITSEIVIAFQGGDKEAFDSIYKHYYNHVYFFAKNHLGNAEIAKDVVQNTFIAVCKSIKTLKAPEAFHVWIMRIAYYECVNIMRKNKIKVVNLSEEQDLDAFGDTNAVPMSEHLEDTFLYEIVYKEIQSLSHKFKDVAILKYLEGFSEEEISQVLKIPKGTVKSRIHKVKLGLQEALVAHDITPTTYKTYSTAIPTVLSSTLFYVYANQGEIPKMTIDFMKFFGTSSVGLLSSLFAKTSVKVATSALVATPLIVIGLQSLAPTPSAVGMPIKETVIPEKDIAQISSVDYEKGFTNQDILLNVAITNENYDTILVNDSEDLRISANGTYAVKVMKDGKVVDEQSVVITNIDKDLPQYLSYVDNNGMVTVYLNDEGSGINPNGITYKMNDTEKESFEYHPQSQTITFMYEEYSSNIFTVADMANNEIKITIISENRYRNE